MEIVNSTGEYFTYTTVATIMRGETRVRPGENQRPSAGCWRTISCMAEPTTTVLTRDFSVTVSPVCNYQLGH